MKYNGYPILAIQQGLTAAGLNTPRTGYYTAQTITNVKAFQRANGLVADGLVGRLTWAKILIQTVVGTPTYAYRWMRCATAVATTVTSAPTAAPASCSYIDGATGNSYTPVAADRGKYLVSEVTASTVADAAKTRWSFSTVVVP
jgi:peptidoglycan hydrolase-like protein with peptidoglycan-binding domain